MTFADNALVGGDEVFESANALDCSATSVIYASKITLGAYDQTFKFAASCTAYLYHVRVGSGDAHDAWDQVITSTSQGVVINRFFTFPCDPGSWSLDGVEHGASIDEYDPTCDAAYSANCVYGAVCCAQECQPCAAGKYRSFTVDSARTTGADSCLDVPVGRYLADAATDASLHDDLDDSNLCSPGSYADGVGFAVCTLCAVGRYAKSDGSLFCDACEPGSACEPRPRAREHFFQTAVANSVFSLFLFRSLTLSRSQVLSLSLSLSLSLERRVRGRR